LCAATRPRGLRSSGPDERKLADEAGRRRLLEQLERSAFLRGQRAASGLAAPGLLVAPGVKHRTVYDAHHGTRLPGKLVRTETAAPVTDAAVDEAFDGAGTTYDFYLQVLQRNSIDGRGLGIDSSVHYGKRFNNAFWNGRQMVYGDGDGKLFTGFTRALDVIAHELTHVVKQWHLKQTVKKADWLIGAGIMTPAVGHALRSMADPGNTRLTWSGDDQPGTRIPASPTTRSISLR
jgi:Zn-dependent metalloprotease